MSVLDVEFGYHSLSHFNKKPTFSELVLSHHAELDEINCVPCFFTGSITEPVLTARCLMTLAKVVQASFAPIPVRLLDPIVTTGCDAIRFEGFSSCNGVYARLDVVGDGLDGEFLASGTTNVDFNDPMINALNAVKKDELMLLAVGDDKVQVQTETADVTEKKVRLPERWIKGLTSVQVYMAQMTPKAVLNKLQVMQFFSQIPKTRRTAPMYLVSVGGRYQMSPLPKADGVYIGGVERLRLFESLLPFVDKMAIYQADGEQSVAFEFYMKNTVMTAVLSPECYRGFSGEGAVLDKLTDIPAEFVHAFNHLLKANETFDPTLISFEHDLDFSITEQMTASLSAMGLLGYDLGKSEHYYRRLPFKMEKIMALNPRFKNAKKLTQAQDVRFVKNTPQHTEARVAGTDVVHTVVIKGDKPQCTCQWFAKHQTKRGLCKHILAVKMASAEQSSSVKLT